jgi:hypothetical protein
MPRSNREYLLRYADQAINDLERGLERLQMLSDAYGGVYRPLDGDVLPELKEVPEGYEGQHGKYQQYVDLVAAQIMPAYEELKLFRNKFM